MTEKLIRHQINPISRPPAHFDAPSSGMTPDEHKKAVESATIPSNIYRPEQVDGTNNQESK